MAYILIPNRLYFLAPRMMKTVPFSKYFSTFLDSLFFSLLFAIPAGREWSPQRVMQSRGESVCASRL